MRTGRDLVLTRLVEVLLVEALRATPSDDASPGLLRGLADVQLAPALRQIARSSQTLMDCDSAREDSRAITFSIFRTLHANYRPAADGISARVAYVGRKGLASSDKSRLAEVAERVGYASASTFSTAFSRHVGKAPSRYARVLNDFKAHRNAYSAVRSQNVRLSPTRCLASDIVAAGWTLFFTHEYRRRVTGVPPIGSRDAAIVLCNSPIA